MPTAVTTEDEEEGNGVDIKSRLWATLDKLLSLHALLSVSCGYGTVIIQIVKFSRVCAGQKMFSDREQPQTQISRHTIILC